MIPNCQRRNRRGRVESDGTEGRQNCDCDAQSDTSSVVVFHQPSTHVGPMEDGHRSPWMVRTIPTVTFVAQRHLQIEKPV